MEKMSAGVGSKKKRKTTEKLTMELYLDFIRSNKTLDLVYDHFNQIIGMHGFKKIYNQHKSVLIEALNSMELMDPARSTVDVDGVSSDALLSVDEVMMDLSELKWEDDCLASLQGSPDCGSGGGGSTSLTVPTVVVEPPSKRRLRKLRDILDERGGLVSGDSSDCEGSGTALCFSSPVPTKKRGVRRIKVGKIGWGGGSKPVDEAGLMAEVAVENQPLSSSPWEFTRSHSC